MNEKSQVKIITPINVVGFILVMMAGWVDAVGLKMFTNERSSFMTGRGSKLGEYLFNGDMNMFMFIVLIVVSFMAGAFISTIITAKNGLVGGLLFTSIMLVVAALGGASQVIIAAIAIPMAMGSQNAATSLTGINRTTHLTGPATDVGMNFAKGDINMAVFWILRWIGFPIGTALGFLMHSLHEANGLNKSLILIIPAIVIAATGIIQKSVVNIPVTAPLGKLKNGTAK